LVNKNDTTVANDPWLFKPIAISLFFLVLGIILTVWDVKEGRRHFKMFDTFILFITGLGGVIAFYLMFFSLHPLVRSNLNLLWLNPLNIILAFSIWIKPLRLTLFIYQLVNFLFLLGALIVFAISLQTFNIATFPIIVLLLLRSTSWFALTKRKIFKRTKK
jgi:hypothetical protein